MKLDSMISEHLGKLQLFSSSPQAVEASVSEFAEAWRELGCTILQRQLQAHLEEAEASYAGARQRRPKRYHTPLGTIALTRRVYNEGGECLGATALGLPIDGWFSAVKELGCAVGVGSEFANANRLLCPTRSTLRHREYIATLEGVETFREHLNRCYTQTVQQHPHQVVFLGDGAAWIWLMAALYFPDAIQILDFFHVSEYLWEVARNAFAGNTDQQHAWVDTQQDALRESQWHDVVAAAQRLPPDTAALGTSIERLVSYLEHNQTRMTIAPIVSKG